MALALALGFELAPLCFEFAFEWPLTSRYQLKLRY